MSKKVRLCQVPTSSGLRAYINPDDFVDCYTVESQLPARQAAEICVTFPAWVRLLMQLRRLVTAPFGLINDAESHPDKIGIFPIESETTAEILAGFDDRHLNFRISVLAQAGQIYFATWVQPHNLGGRLYLKMVLPFHILICRNALRRVGQTATPLG
ncbi:MAG: DUF2867 domain-containing protein [Pseudomonadota bacterium]